MPTNKQVMEIAKSQIGYTEGAKNNNKYGKKYGENNCSWCAIFLWWCGNTAAEKYKGLNPIAKCDNVYIQEQTVRRGGRWILTKTTSASKKKAVLKKLKYGDIVSFDFGKKDNYRDHVGFVVGVSDDYIITIEGNTQPQNGKAKVDGVHERKRKYTEMCAVVRPCYTSK